MFPFGPHSPGGDGAAGAEERPPLGGPAAASRPPSPAPRPAPPRQGADAAPPPPAARSPRLPGGPALSPAECAGELAAPGALELSAAAAQAELSPSSSPRRRSRPDCRAGNRSRQGLSAGLSGPGARLFGWLRERSLGRGLFVDPARDNFRTMTNLYGSIHPADSVYLSTRTHGAVFNLEYSPDGSVLTVACEQTEVLLFDPISSKHIKTLSEAHEDCVNNIRFLDNRLFATCSDDTTIALWDLRKLNTKVCTLHGHTSWVKNIEYDTNTRLLVTSGFDGNVIIWDTNRCTEDGCPHKKFFHTRFLMRMRLTPDCSKMLISTSSGYLLILHDLDLTKSLEVGSYPILRARRTTSSSDLTTSSSSGSRVSGSPCHHSDSNSSEKHMSRASQREGVSPRNSLEVLTPEVPGERDRGNCITSLQLHPKGWATLLRCSSNTDDQEWTCVYEFQEGAPVRPVSPRCSLRLTHYIEEANVGRGYIKELCFSPDGRMISSPHGYGIRLLGFDKQCSELVDCLPKEASPLRVIRSLYSHNDVVLTTKFSPTHCQIASGCLSGRVSLYQPKF
ncbi:DDB1- and CUL4-associated factor 10 isoform X1 [Cricetulus griseus]|uniref:DDB1- and CUL4-associated factor 10 n=1 Tax=Cricetulus griseus TaxID=10029 RepID=A0A8C2QLP9_CRIGR|nr:DDB1- and CUL4-associated factor 10 isoform X3 [Cricetulus griseus]XP_035313239.1 DDB1- and CUL4-associated factor 10 isoform X1 [Cricetulus griseus]